MTTKDSTAPTPTPMSASDPDHTDPGRPALPSLLLTPITMAQHLAPASPVPVVLAAGALVLAGVVELPIAGAIALGYFALQRWHPNR